LSFFSLNYCAQKNKASEKVIVDNEIGERDACSCSFFFCLVGAKVKMPGEFLQ
jgi:hypothetical protein